MRRYSWIDIRTFFKTTVVRWRTLEPELMAAGLSYFALFSLAPLLLVILTVASLIMSKPAAQQLIIDRVSMWMTDEATDAITSWIDKPIGKHSKSAAIFGLLVAAWAGSQVIGYMKRILNRIWETRTNKRNVFWKDYLSSLVFNLITVGLLGLFLTFSLIFDTMAGLFWNFFREVLPDNIIHFASWVQGINFAFSMFCFCLLFALIYRFVPDIKMEWEDVWAGALLTSILLAIGKVAISLYLNYASFASGYGAASSILIVLLSTYIGCHVFIFGGVFTRTYSEHYGSRRHVHKKS